jgi:hypothetical protein
VPSRRERVERLAVAEEDPLLILLDDQLRAEFNIGRAFLRDALDELIVRLVKKLNDLKPDAHGAPSYFCEVC